jgi:hypothetical protein
MSDYCDTRLGIDKTISSCLKLGNITNLFKIRADAILKRFSEDCFGTKQFSITKQGARSEYKVSLKVSPPKNTDKLY